MPKNCSGVPSEILNPRETWKDKNEYDKMANELAKKFVENFKKFADHVNEETLKAAPLVS
jgi:phosphoenolpyruvate carboxykinase (ATP)